MLAVDCIHDIEDNSKELCYATKKITSNHI